MVLHGSTVVINAILERRGAQTALITTRGFRDVYEIGRINRPESFNLFFRKHVPLVSRSRRFEVEERLNAEGEVLVPFNQVQAVAARLFVTLSHELSREYREYERTSTTVANAFVGPIVRGYIDHLEQVA